MKTSSLTREIIIWLIILIPFAYLGLSWNQLPDRIPVHFNLQGEANGWGSKSSLVGILFATTVLMNLLLLFIPKLDPKGKIENMGGKYDQMRLLMVLFMAALATFIVYNALIVYNAPSQHSFNPNLLLILVGGLFVVLGNYFPALKPNYFIGIRTPWTLESETVWRKTHRMGGRLWLIGGIIIITAALLPYNNLRMIILVSTIVTITLIPTIYSFLELRKEQQANA